MARDHSKRYVFNKIVRSIWYLLVPSKSHKYNTSLRTTSSCVYFRNPITNKKQENPRNIH